MLTIADALQLPIFSGATVVAGHNGLHKPVTWVHVVGVPDAARWLNGGELVLTTAINLPPDPESQCDYVQALADKGVAALALSIGRFLTHIPAHMREVADHNNLVLIEIPFQTPFVDIAKSTNEQIFHENMAAAKHALYINRVLTQLVLDGGDFNQLAATLAALIEHSVSIENERFEALASANIAAFDEARRYTLSEGRTDPRLVHALEDRDVLGQIRRTLRPVFIRPMPDVGLEMERILAPIVVHGEIYGYMWIIAHQRPLSDLDHMAIESGATIAALMLLHSEAVQSAEASLKGSLLSQLIDGVGAREAVLTDIALRFGFDLSASFVLLLVTSTDATASKLAQLQHRMNRVAHEWPRPMVVGQFAGQVILLAHAEADIARLVELVQGNGVEHVAVSATHRGAEAVALAYQQCREALHIAQRLHMDETAIYFSDLGYLHTLYQAGVTSVASNPHVPGVRKLLDEQQADLFNTLEAYLDAGGNAVATAEALHVHRSTLNYRLERIEKICMCDLSKATTRTNLQVALKLVRLFEQP
jgi:purine catabolism regulator